MCSIKQSPEIVRSMITWPSGPPSRLLNDEGVKPPPQSIGQPQLVTVSALVGGAAVSRFAPGDLFSPPGGSMQNSAPSLSGDPGNPRPPTREELIKLLKGCDALGGNKNHRS